MDHTLIIPEDLVNSLKDARNVDEVYHEWQQINVDTVEDMINRIIDDMNEKFCKLNIFSYRIESKENIRKAIGNKGNNSIYTGYLENKQGNVDGLFFYIPPMLNSGNDILTRQVMPVLIGIYEGVGVHMVDLHFHNRPVFVVNLNETSRMEQPAVKSSIICAEMMKIGYLDIFQRTYYDILPDADENQDYSLPNKIADFDRLLTQNGNKNNEYFVVDEENRIIRILSSRLENSSNLTAELYRYCMRIIPVIYMASKEKYVIDMEELKRIQNDKVEIIIKFISKYHCKN